MPHLHIMSELYVVFNNLLIESMENNWKADVTLREIRFFSCPTVVTVDSTLGFTSVHYNSDQGCLPSVACEHVFNCVFFRHLWQIIKYPEHGASVVEESRLSNIICHLILKMGKKT